MPLKRFSMDPGIMDVPDAAWLLTDLVEKGEGRYYRGYKPFELFDYRPDRLVLECPSKDIKAVRKFLKAYLSGEAEKLRKTM